MSEQADLQVKFAQIDTGVKDQGEKIKKYQELFLAQLAAKKFQSTKFIIDHCIALQKMTIYSVERGGPHDCEQACDILVRKRGTQKA